MVVVHSHQANDGGANDPLLLAQAIFDNIPS
jgi:hypothetical protein